MEKSGKKKILWLRSERLDRISYTVALSHAPTTTCICMGTFAAFTSGSPLSHLNSNVPGGDSYYESNTAVFVGAIASQERSLIHLMRTDE